MNVYCIVMFEFNYSVGDIRNSDLGEGIICSGEGSGVRGGGKWGKGGGERSGGKGGGSGGKGGGKWGMPTHLSTPSLVCLKTIFQIIFSFLYKRIQSSTVYMSPSMEKKCSKIVKWD